MKDDAKIMADLLRSGHTMLNKSCPLCNNPIFRNKDDEIFCPICKRKVLFVEKNSEFVDDPKEKLMDRKHITKNSVGDFSEIKLIIIEKIKWASQKLNSENQIEMVERYTKLVKDLCEIIKSVTQLT